MRIAFNVGSLYAAWFATVLAAANGRPGLAVTASAIVIVVNVALSSDGAAEMRLVLQAACVGFIFDAVVINSGLARYASPGPITAVPPLWLIAMWMAFATSLNVSLAWLKDRLTLAALLGSIAGPLSYYAGARLGGMQFLEPLWVALAALSLLWTLTFPLLLFLSRRDKITQSGR